MMSSNRNRRKRRMKNIIDEDRRADVWIEAREALDWARAALQSYDGAKALLEGALRGGKLHALADDLFVEPDMGKVGTWVHNATLKRASHLASDLERGNIKKKFWSQRSVSFYDDNLWDWEGNRFATTDEPEIMLEYDEDEKNFMTKVGRRYVADGVSFLHDEVGAVIDDHVSKFGIVAGNSRRQPKWDREKIFSPYRKMIKEGKFEQNFGPFEKTGKQAKLEESIKKMAGEVDGNPPSESTARRLAKEILNEYRHDKSLDLEP